MTISSFLVTNKKGHMYKIVHYRQVDSIVQFFLRTQLLKKQDVF